MRTTTSRPYKFRSSFLNSTQLLDAPLPLPSPNFSQPHVYSVTVIRRKSMTTPAPESLIMVRDTESNKTKDEQPTNIVYPPTGDTSELEDYDDDEEEDEDDVNAEDDKTKDSSEEAADEDQEVINSSKSKENANSDVSSMVSQEVKVVPAPTTLKATTVVDKGDKGTLVVQADAAKNKRKKKKKKKKRRKKPEFHFVPAPLGPKADLMIRLDKVHHNVKNIVSVVKGVFTDYVVNRPYVNVELYKGIHAYTYKMGSIPPVKIKYERSNIQSLLKTDTIPPFRNNNLELFSWPSKYPGADMRAKNHQQPEGSSVKTMEKNSNQISKRILEEDCADDITCEGEVRRSVSKKVKRPKSQPRPTGRYGHHQVKKNRPLTLPYPVYIESMYDDSCENDPFKHLPPMRPSQFMKAEKNWVKTWDKEETGLPPIAGADEASMSSSKRRKSSKKNRRKKEKKGKVQ